MIAWTGYVLVAATTLLAASLIVGLFSAGVRLHAESAGSETPRALLVKTGAYACFMLCGLAVVYGIYLIIPALHK